LIRRRGIYIPLLYYYLCCLPSN